MVTQSKKALMTTTHTAEYNKGTLLRITSGAQEGSVGEYVSRNSSTQYKLQLSDGTLVYPPFQAVELATTEVECLPQVRCSDDLPYDQRVRITGGRHRRCKARVAHNAYKRKGYVRVQIDGQKHRSFVRREHVLPVRDRQCQVEPDNDEWVGTSVRFTGCNLQHTYRLVQFLPVSKVLVRRNRNESYVVDSEECWPASMPQSLYRRVRESPGLVYVMDGFGNRDLLRQDVPHLRMCKIGRTKDDARLRKKQLATGNPLLTLAHTEKVRSDYSVTEAMTRVLAFDQLMITRGPGQEWYTLSVDDAKAVCREARELTDLARYLRFN